MTELATYLADDFVVLQHAPLYIYAVIVPVAPRHVLVDVGVDSRHAGDILPRGQALDA